jgi:hypothetical protein
MAGLTMAPTRTSPEVALEGIHFIRAEGRWRGGGVVL